MNVFLTSITDSIIADLEGIAAQSTELFFFYAKNCRSEVVQNALLSLSGELMSSTYDLLHHARRYRSLAKRQAFLFEFLKKPNTNTPST